VSGLLIEDSFLGRGEKVLATSSQAHTEAKIQHRATTRNVAESASNTKNPYSHYKMVVQLSCFCVDRGSWTVEVLDGEILSVDPALPYGLGEGFATVAWVQSRIGADVYAHGLQVTYNSQGIPVVVYIDRDGNTADDELGITLTEFEELP
jgi:hypothetical protein